MVAVPSLNLQPGGGQSVQTASNAGFGNVATRADQTGNQSFTLPKPVDNGLGAAGQALTSAGDALFQFQSDQQDQADLNFSLETENKVRDFVSQQKIDMSRRSLGQAQGVGDEVAKSTAKFMAGLIGDQQLKPQAMARLQAMIQRRSDGVMNDARLYEQDQTKKHTVGLLTGRVGNAIQDAANAYSSFGTGPSSDGVANSYDAAIDAIRTSNIALGKQNGLTAEEVNAQNKNDVSAAHKSAITAAISANDTRSAQNILETSIANGEIDGGDIAGLRDSLNAANVSQAGFELSDTAQVKFPDNEKDQRAYLAKEFKAGRITAPEREAAIRNISGSAIVRNRVRTETNRKLSEDAWTDKNLADQNAKLSQEQNVAMSSFEKQSWNEAHQRALSGFSQGFDVKTEESFMEIYTDPEQWASFDLHKFRTYHKGKMSEGQYKNYSNMFKASRNPDTQINKAYKAEVSAFKQSDDRVKAILQTIGIGIRRGKSLKQQSSDKRISDEVRIQARDFVQKTFKTTGSYPSDLELNKFLGGFTVSGNTFSSSIFGGTSKDKETTKAESLITENPDSFQSRETQDLENRFNDFLDSVAVVRGKEIHPRTYKPLAKHFGLSNGTVEKIRIEMRNQGLPFTPYELFKALEFKLVKVPK